MNRAQQSGAAQAACRGLPPGGCKVMGRKLTAIVVASTSIAVAMLAAGLYATHHPVWLRPA